MKTQVREIDGVRHGEKELKETREIIKSFQLNRGRLQEKWPWENKGKPTIAPPESERASKHEAVRALARYEEAPKKGPESHRKCLLVHPGRGNNARASV